MDKLKREYDRFGPWVAEIKEEDDIPQQFSDFTETILKSDFSFKVPVSEERRNLKPGMVLYETVVSLTGDFLIVLRYGEDSIDRQEIHLKGLKYFQRTITVLKGELTLATAKQISIIQFNSVEQKPIEKLESRIREHYCDPEPKINLEEIIEQDHVHSFLYETILAKETKKENLKIVAYQPNIKLKREHVSMMRRWQVVSDEYGLQDSLFLTNGRELIVLSRVQDMKAVKKSDYGYRYTYIPLSKIRTLLREPVEKVQGIHNFSVVMENNRVVFKVEESFPVDAFGDTLKIEY